VVELIINVLSISVLIGVISLKKVMVVDDAAFMRCVLKQMLERNGFEVVGEAENGMDAVNKYKELHPDLVTMDITMPELDGVEATKVIRQLDSNARIIMISAMGQERMVRDAIVAGAAGFIVKPFKEEFVMQTINRL